MCEMKKHIWKLLLGIHLFCISGKCMFCSINEEKLLSLLVNYCHLKGNMPNNRTVALQENSGRVRREVHRISVGLVYITTSVNATSVTTGKSHKYHCLQVHEETARCEEGLWIYSPLVTLHECLKLR